MVLTNKPKQTQTKPIQKQHKNCCFSRQFVTCVQLTVLPTRTIDPVAVRAYKLGKSDIRTHLVGSALWLGDQLMCHNPMEI